MIRVQETISEIISRFPASARVFERHNISYCCGGSLSLETAAQNRGLEPSALILEIEHEIKAAGPSELEDWGDRSTPELITHILMHYHRPLDDELPRLAALASKVAHVHGPANESLRALSRVVSKLTEELEQHFIKEEQVLFPAFLAEGDTPLMCPIEVMLKDHQDADELLTQVRALTDDYHLPLHACGSWRALWGGLESLETSLHEHIFLENEILFPRFIQS